MTLTALRERTRSLHQALERRIDPVRQIQTAADYRALLERYYGLIVPFEAEPARLAAWATLGLDVEPRLKAPLLERDLRALGATSGDLGAIARCDDLPRPAGPGAAVGQLYVLEGSTLGGQVIARHVASRLGITVASGGAYFVGYGAQTRAMWASFLEALMAFANRSGETQALIGGACDAFMALDRWFARWQARGEP